MEQLREYDTICYTTEPKGEIKKYEAQLFYFPIDEVIRQFVEFPQFQSIQPASLFFYNNKKVVSVWDKSTNSFRDDKTFEHLPELL